MEPKYVTFEQGKWLFEKDYPPIPKCFNKEGEERTVSVVISRLTESTYYPRPEQHQVVDWLIVNHGIWIEIYMDDDGTFGYLCSKIIAEGRMDHPLMRHFTLPQEAYSAAFDYIKDNNLI
jgi:hypothetical protein